jgi:hypothetical protein
LEHTSEDTDTHKQAKQWKWLGYSETYSRVSLFWNKALGCFFEGLGEAGILILEVGARLEEDKEEQRKGNANERMKRNRKGTTIEEGEGLLRIKVNARYGYNTV